MTTMRARRGAGARKARFTERAPGRSYSGTPAWLDPSFEAPERLEPSTGHHLRQIREADTGIDYPAVMGSQPRLWQRYGEAYGWPRSTMTFDEDRADLARHEREMDALESFNYAILDDAETKLLGCLYIDPPGPGAPPGAEATASWWVVDEAVGTPLELELSEALPRWLADAWGSGPCITTRERPVRLGVEQKEERSPAEASVSSR